MKVWGCSSYNGVGDLYRIKGTLTEQKYHSTLQNTLYYLVLSYVDVVKSTDLICAKTT